MAPDSFLEYGAMGILLAVLVAVGVFLRGYMAREQERQAERDKEDRQDRRDLTASFRTLVERDVEAKDALKDALDSLCAEVGAARAADARITAVLKKLVEGQELHERQASERHRQQMEQAREMTAALRRINGK